MDEFTTAILHEAKKEGKDTAILQTLFDIQDEMDAYYAASASGDGKGHAHNELWNKEAAAAEVIVGAHKHERIVDVIVMSCKDGSYGNEEQEDAYDGFIKSHPELIKKPEHASQPKITDKVPSMLRVHNFPKDKSLYKRVDEPEATT